MANPYEAFSSEILRNVCVTLLTQGSWRASAAPYKL